MPLLLGFRPHSAQYRTLTPTYIYPAPRAQPRTYRTRCENQWWYNTSGYPMVQRAAVLLPVCLYILYIVSPPYAYHWPTSLFNVTLISNSPSILPHFSKPSLQISFPRTTRPHRKSVGKGGVHSRRYKPLAIVCPLLHLVPKPLMQVHPIRL